MLDLAEARRRAQRRLDKMSSQTPLVLTGEQEFPIGWVFFYDSESHYETGSDASRLAGNAPILVDRETGETHTTGTAHPVEHYVNEYAELQRRCREGWPEGLTERLLTLLAAVRDGGGKRDARTLDMLTNTKHRPTEHTVLEELQELQHRQLVNRQPDDQGGVGGRWQITMAGQAALEPGR